MIEVIWNKLKELKTVSSQVGISETTHNLHVSKQKMLSD